MGGGGGAGQGNNNNTYTIDGAAFGGYPIGSFWKGPSKGADGGGIVIIKASQIIASGSRTISAKGGTAGWANQDGAGGGGGGGNIIIEAPTYSGMLSLDVSGGEGGYTLNSGSATVDCHGPGGGGGGGRVLLSVGVTPGGVTINTSGGPAGKLLERYSSAGKNYLMDKTGFCGADIYSGAVAGTTGTITYTTPVNTQTCTLPVTLISFEAVLLENNQVELSWKTSKEVNSSYFTIEKSTNGINFEEAGTVSAKGNSKILNHYSFTDENHLTSSGTIYYRLRIVDLDGTFEYSKLAGVVLKGSVISIYPNPLEENRELNVVYSSNIEQEEIGITIFNMLGKRVYSSNIKLKKGNNTVSISAKDFIPGAYMVEISGEYGTSIQKIFIK
jgi:hypothetical protein